MFTGSFSPKTNDKPIVFSYLFFYYSLWSLDKTQGKINEVNHQLPIRCRVLRVLRAGENFRIDIFSIWWKLATFYILMNCFRTISIHILKVENFRKLFKNFFGSFIGKRGTESHIEGSGSFWRRRQATKAGDLKRVAGTYFQYFFRSIR